MAEEMDLDRFVEAQDQDRAYARALTELERGAKRTHWMWFVFPQLRGLGSSPTAQFYGIQDLDEARHYLAHPVLGRRLAECSLAVLGIEATAEEIFGPVDAMKLASCMTLFDAVTPESVFAEVLEKFYAGRRDPFTLDRI